MGVKLQGTETDLGPTPGTASEGKQPDLQEQAKLSLSLHRLFIMDIKYTYRHTHTHTHTHIHTYTHLN